MTALLIAAGGLIVAVIGNAIIDPSPRSMPPLFCGRARDSAPAEPSPLYSPQGRDSLADVA
jgi:hypothetical protein